MDPGTLAGHLHRDPSADPVGALHGLARAVASGARRAAVIALVLALLAGCQSSFTFRPFLLPIAITIGPDGSIEVSFDPELVTPIGTFSMSVPLTRFRVTGAETLLVIVFLAAVVSDASAQHGSGVPADLARYDTGHGGDIGAAPVMKQEIIKINRYVPMQFLVDGPTPDPEVRGNIVTLRPGSGVTGIRVKEISNSPGAKPFSVLQVPILPPAPGITAPPPAPRVACTPAGSAGTFSCSATPGVVGFAYQWFADGAKIGTGNPLTVTLPVGVHLITVTVTGSHYSFSSPPLQVEVKISTAAASRGPPAASYAIS